MVLNGVNALRMIRKAITNQSSLSIEKRQNIWLLRQLFKRVIRNPIVDFSKLSF